MARDTSQEVVVTFDSTSYTCGIYTGAMCLVTNDTVRPLVQTPMTMTVGTLSTCGFDSSSPDYLGETTVFTNTSVNTLTYRWSFGDGSPLSTDIHPTHQCVAVGGYAVTLTVTNACSADQKTIVVIVNPPPCPHRGH